MKTDEGGIHIKTYRIRHSRKQYKNLKCLQSGCNQVFTYVKEMNMHMKEAHQDLHFCHSYCLKTYMTYNARYKHEHSHFELPYVCHYCKRRFLFPSLCDKHECQNTETGLLPCTWPDCKRMLSCKDALCQHVDTHISVNSVLKISILGPT